MADHYFPGLENLKHSLSLTDIDPFIEYTNHLIPNHQQQFQLSFLNSNHMGFPHDNLCPHFPEFPGNSENFSGLSIQGMNNGSNLVHQPPVDDIKTISSDQSSDPLKKKRKEMDYVMPENSSAYSSPQVSDNGITKKNNSSGRGKKSKRSDEKEDDKTREVVHVRAKRGQATDSHSLAERVRRGKINERLKCLQDIVPGCYKTMGMAVMLDEIINYVQSLQNQVEFLSMKLTAASTYYDYNSDIDTIEAMQRSNALEAFKMHNTQSQGLPLSSHQFAQLNENFGYLPQLPHNR